MVQFSDAWFVTNSGFVTITEICASFGSMTVKNFVQFSDL